jgi:hypothetical protein
MSALIDSARGRKAVVPPVHAQSGQELRNTTAEADFIHVVPAGVAGDAAVFSPSGVLQRLPLAGFERSIT